MDDRSVCAPQLAESDALNNTTSPPHAASVTDASKVINTKIDSAQFEGEMSEEEPLKVLLTDDYCHLCDAVLLFESQRLSHYEGKKHAQKLRLYLQARRAEKMNRVSSGHQQTVMTDNDRFCELCNMVFSSHIVAKSHYEGKIHSKNLRKQGQQPQVTDGHTEVHHLPNLSRDPAVQKTAPECGLDRLALTATTAAPTEVDLKDPDKYCALCALSFNNPQMALQHYNGRKHQKNQSRQKIIKTLRDDIRQAKSLMCKICNAQCTSVEMYQAHMQGNKHQIRQKKVADSCKSQQKTYSTFADELSDYIQIQKARGITPRPKVLPVGEEEEEKEVLTKEDFIEPSKPLPPRCYNPSEGWRPPYPGPPWQLHGGNYTCPPPPFPPDSSSPLFAIWPVKKRHRKQLTSSNITSSSSSSSCSSSYSSSTSDSGTSESRRRERRKLRRSRKERDRREKNGDSGKEEKRRERDKDSDRRRRGDSIESEEERRKESNYHVKQGKRNKKSRMEDLEVLRGEKMMDNLRPEDAIDNTRQTGEQFETETNVDLGDSGQDELTRPKNRRDKKKTREKVDTRTEEEKLWDDSILGF